MSNAEERGADAETREEAVKTICIESPYAGDVEKNVAYLKRCIMDALGRGESPYASHLFFTQPGLLDDLVPEERTLGIEAGFCWSRMADLRVFYIDRGISRGMQLGWSDAMKHGQACLIRNIEPISGDPVKSDTAAIVKLEEKKP